MGTRAAPGGGRAVVIAVVGLAACTGGGDDTGYVGLPPQDTSTWREDTGTFPFDTADTGPTDEAPEHVLAVRHEGTWRLGGSGADPSSVTGTLVVTEVLDGDEETPACVAEWALVGTRAAEDCDGCDYTFVVQHALVATEGACRAPELPEDGEERRLGYDGAAIWWDWYDSGVWVPLWEAEPGELPDEIVFSWETTLGVAVEEE